MGADGEARLSAGRAQRMEGRCISTSRLARNGDRGNLRRLQRKREAPRRYKASSDSSAFFRGYIQSGSSFDSCDVHKRKMPIPGSLTVIARLGIAPWARQGHWADRNVFRDVGFCHAALSHIADDKSLRPGRWNSRSRWPNVCFRMFFPAWRSNRVCHLPLTSLAYRQRLVVTLPRTDSQVRSTQAPSSQPQRSLMSSSSVDIRFQGKHTRGFGRENR
jgi:hypothetical protein